MALRGWSSGKTLCAPSRHCVDTRVYGHTTSGTDLYTATHEYCKTRMWFQWYSADPQLMKVALCPCGGSTPPCPDTTHNTPPTHSLCAVCSPPHPLDKYRRDALATETCCFCWFLEIVTVVITHQRRQQRNLVLQELSTASWTSTLCWTSTSCWTSATDWYFNAMSYYDDVSKFDKVSNCKQTSCRTSALFWSSTTDRTSTPYQIQRHVEHVHHVDVQRHHELIHVELQRHATNFA